MRNENVNDKDMEYMISQYRHSTFRGPLNYYKTSKINFEEELPFVENSNINVPAWIILAERDPFLKPHMAVMMKEFIPLLKTTSVDADHFVMVENPEDFNKALLICLEDLKQQRRPTKAVL